MAWLTHTFNRYLSIINDPQKTSYDPEVLNKINHLCRSIIANPKIGISIADAEIHPKKEIEESLKYLVTLGNCRLVEEALDRWPRQIVYVVYAVGPSPKPRQIPGPGFLIWNVCVGEKSIMIHNKID